MNIKEAAKILVLDPIHGAEVITEELKEFGKEAKIFNPRCGTIREYGALLKPMILSRSWRIFHFRSKKRNEECGSNEEC